MQVKEFDFQRSTKGIKAIREEREAKMKSNDSMERAFPTGIYALPSGPAPKVRFRDMD